MSDFPFYFVAAPRQVAAVARRVCAERSFPFVGVVSFLLDAADAVASEFSLLSTPRRAEVRRRVPVIFVVRRTLSTSSSFVRCRATSVQEVSLLYIIVLLYDC